MAFPWVIDSLQPHSLRLCVINASHVGSFLLLSGQNNPSVDHRNTSRFPRPAEWQESLIISCGGSTYLGRGENPWDTAKSWAGSRTGPPETLGSTSKEAPKGQRNRFQRVGTLEKGQRLYPPPGWTTKEGMLSLGVVAFFVI